MYIIAGLGNPTSRYEGTRHNIGFDVIDRISEECHIALDFEKHKAICGIGLVGGRKALLAKPQTYMNRSGESVRELVAYYKAGVDELIVVHDDVSLAMGQIRIRTKGSAGGHNGIKSVIAQLGTDRFARVKVGVGGKPQGWDLADYVLGHFSAEEREIMRESVARASMACASMILEGADAAMNAYNGWAAGR